MASSFFKKATNLAKKVLSNAGQAAAQSATNAAVQTVANSITPSTPSVPSVPNLPAVTTTTVVNPANARQKNIVPWIVGGAVGLALIIALVSGGSKKRKK